MPSTKLITIFNDAASAERARQQLIASGFRESEIDYRSASEFASDAATGNTGLTGTAPSDRHSGGGISGWFRSMFGADDDDYTDRYSNAVRSGSTAIVVETDNARVDRAVDILNSNGAVDVDEQTATSRSQNVRRGDTADRVIPVVEEHLAVGKRAVQRGGVRVITRITETPVEEQVTLRDETVKVDRRSVDRPASEADFRAAQGGPIEVREVDEEAVVAKDARVVEEIVVGKQTAERTETVRDTVRRTEVRVEETDLDKKRPQ